MFGALRVKVAEPEWNAPANAGDHTCSFTSGLTAARQWEVSLRVLVSLVRKEVELVVGVDGDLAALDGSLVQNDAGREV